MPKKHGWNHQNLTGHLMATAKMETDGLKESDMFSVLTTPKRPCSE